MMRSPWCHLVIIIKLKDFIRTQFIQGYQSSHYTVLCDDLINSHQSSSLTDFLKSCFQQPVLINDFSHKFFITGTCIHCKGPELLDQPPPALITQCSCGPFPAVGCKGQAWDKWAWEKMQQLSHFLCWVQCKKGQHFKWCSANMSRRSKLNQFKYFNNTRLFLLLLEVAPSLWFGV